MIDGIRVLDLSWVLGGPFGGQLLAQLGADVIKIEPPQGDLSRTIPPHYFEGDSSFFLSVNRGKKSVSLDLKDKAGLNVFYDLVRESHAVIYGFAPQVPHRLGIDFQTLKELNPSIAVGEMIGIDDRGPHAEAPAFDLIIQALGGVMAITGDPATPPPRIGYQIADLAAGLYLGMGTLAALLQALISGSGQKVQVSMLDCQLALLTWQAQNFFISGDTPRAAGSRHPMIAPSEVFTGEDGEHFVISPTGQRFWSEFCQAIDRTDLADDARFETPESRIHHVDELANELQELFGTKPRESWVELLQRRRIPAAPVNRIDEALAHPAAVSRSMVEKLTNPRTGGLMSFLGSPFKYEGVGQLSYPPAVGGDTRDVLSEVLKYDHERITALHDQGAIKLGEKEER